MRRWHWILALVSSVCLAACGGTVGNGEDYSGSWQTNDEGLSDGMGDVTEQSAVNGATGTEGADAASGAAESVSSESQDSEESREALSGEELFNAECAACHGAGGVGTELAPEVQHPCPEFFDWVVRAGREGVFDVPMLPYAENSLSDAELELILNYLTGLPQPETDEGLYLDYCANCHGANARGGPVNKHIAGKDEFLEVVRKGKGGDDYAARTRYMPGWSGDELPSDFVERMQEFVGALPE